MRLESARRPCRIALIVGVLLAIPALGAEAEPVRKPQFELVGVVKREGDASLALLKEPQLTAGAEVLLRVGQSIGDYRLIAVEEDRVSLESPTGVITVTLAGTKDSSSSTAAAPLPKPQPEARPAPSAPAEPAPNPVAAAPQDAVRPEPTMSAEESVDAALKGTPGGKLLEVLKNAFGLGAAQQ